mmetsp:Transcript_45674/g.74486  ORF Transcript_45674/g.74486 Transcript_45674/m.74486 type:complete len:222 (+) Transcript_45674:500-1165(+)
MGSGHWSDAKLAKKTSPSLLLLGAGTTICIRCGSNSVSIMCSTHLVLVSALQDRKLCLVLIAFFMNSLGSELHTTESFATESFVICCEFGDGEAESSASALSAKRSFMSLSIPGAGSLSHCLALAFCRGGPKGDGSSRDWGGAEKPGGKPGEAKTSASLGDLALSGEDGVLSVMMASACLSGRGRGAASKVKSSLSALDCLVLWRDRVSIEDGKVAMGCGF